MQGSTSNQRNDGTWTANFQLGVFASQMEAIVSQLEALGRVTGRQFNGLALGDLSRIDPDAMGTIQLALSEKSTITPGSDSATGTIRRSVHDGIVGFYCSVGFIAYVFIAAARWIVISAFVAWVAWRSTRSSRARRA